MRKTITSELQPVRSRTLTDECGLDLAALAQVWLTSESSECPIESVLSADANLQWRAEFPGEQLIRFVFDQPLMLKRIQLVFNEVLLARTQEFVLRWWSEDEIVHEVLRQQYHFSPPNTCLEIEDYKVNLPQLKGFELSINPDISNHNAFASLQQLILS